MNKRIMALGLLGLSLSMAVPVTNYAKEIETDKEIVTNIEGNEVLETSVTAEEYEAFGEGAKAGEEVQAISTENSSRSISCSYNWTPRNTSWSVKISGLNDYKLGFTRFLIQNKFTRSGKQYTGTLYDESIQLGLLNNGTYTPSGKVGPTAGKIQTGDALYVTVKRGNTTVHSCVKSAK